MFKRFVPVGGLVGVFAAAAFGLSAAAAFESSFDRTEAYASFQSDQTYTLINVSRGTSVIESDDRESLQSGTIVSVSIFRRGDPGILASFEFGCFKVADGVFTGGIEQAVLHVSVGPGSGNCGGRLIGGPDGPAIAGGVPDVAVIGGTGLSQALDIDLAWKPTGAVNHDSYSFAHSCLDFSTSSESSRESVRASATGTINGSTVSSSPDFGGRIAAAQGEFSSEGTPSRSCGFFKG